MAQRAAGKDAYIVSSTSLFFSKRKRSSKRRTPRSSKCLQDMNALLNSVLDTSQLGPRLFLLDLRLFLTVACFVTRAGDARDVRQAGTKCRRSECLSISDEQLEDCHIFDKAPSLISSHRISHVDDLLVEAVRVLMTCCRGLIV
eukprot:6187935-Pleurochrysis_carterae.AAC.1